MPAFTPLRRFISASGFTNLADGVAVVVWAWLTSLMTRDAFLIALMPVALRLPWFVLAIPAGVVTDRMDRKRLIVTMDVIRGVAFLGVALLLFVVPLQPPQPDGLAQPSLFLAVFVLAMMVGSAEVFRDNAAQTMMPALVDSSELERANGRLWSVELVGERLIGPALGAFLIAAFVWFPFALNAAAFLGAVFLVSGLKGQFAPKDRVARNWRSEVSEGLTFLRGAPLLMLLAVVTGFWNLFAHMVEIGLILHVQENLGLGATAFGLMLSAGAVGGIVGGFAGEYVVRAWGPGRTAQFALAMSPVSFLGILLAPNAVALAIVLMFFEFWGVVWNTVSVAYRQRFIPDIILGRVNSIYRMLAWGMIPIGLALSGLSVQVAETFMERGTALMVPFYIGCVGITLLVLWAWRPLGAGFGQKQS